MAFALSYLEDHLVDGHAVEELADRLAEGIDKGR